mmetsp:Transcript_7945/g.18946  ORF Transcript_7945/g.18946 Transcript_7945/m.18946 type:complete len:224 (+) Transcript_7945:398-1069(+)
MWLRSIPLVRCGSAILGCHSRSRQTDGQRSFTAPTLHLPNTRERGSWHCGSMGRCGRTMPLAPGCFSTSGAHASSGPMLAPPPSSQGLCQVRPRPMLRAAQTVPKRRGCCCRKASSSTRYRSCSTLNTSRPSHGTRSCSCVSASATRSMRPRRNAVHSANRKHAARTAPACFVWLVVALCGEEPSTARGPCPCCGTNATRHRVTATGPYSAALATAVSLVARG